MKLFDESAKNSYVWATRGAKDRSDTPCSFDFTSEESGQNIGASTKKGAVERVLAHQVPMGRYNAEGLYETFCPAIPGAEGARGLNRYVLHPLAEAERDREKAQKEKANSWQRRAA